MGMTVFAGMLIATILGVLLVPMLFVFVERMIGGKSAHAAKTGPPAQPAVAGAGHGVGGHLS
jgi:HAE1 family hydrophobic/amphiphilic exporter-1